MSDYSRKFLAVSRQIIDEISCEEIEKTVELLENTRKLGGRLFLCGSGGGAGHASHAACDFRKLCGLESYCVSDNVSELTARVNDEGWDVAYSNWLRASRLNSRDCVLFFSVGGGSDNPPVSTNLVSAANLASEVGASIVAIVGRDGGYLRTVASASVLIPQIDSDSVTPQTEGLQAVLWHLFVSHPRLANSKARWEGLSSAVNA